MSKDPQNQGEYYHIAIPLDAFDDPDADAIIRPVSKEEAETLIKLFQDIGRNQPCPCGSGIKFKKCCLRKAS